MYHHRMFHFRAHVTPWHHIWSEAILAVVLALVVFVEPTSAAMRFQQRSLYINDNQPGATADYTLSWQYMSPDAVGSVDILFCQDPIPYHDCVVPAGFSAANATLTQQAGESGFAITTKTKNHIVLTREPTAISNAKSTYTFTGIVNTTDESQAFAVRLKSHASTNATGPQIDFGSVRGQVASGVTLQTQVPPMLIFCLAEKVYPNCAGTNDVYYTDMGTLSDQQTLSAQSEMSVGTNASGGFAITANGSAPSAGTNQISPIQNPTVNTPGTNQFGLNLVANNDPVVGSDPEGQWANALPADDYSVPNQYKYVSGDVVAYSPNVSLMKKFTVSYILNAGPNLRAGMYTTTITFVASGQF